MKKKASGIATLTALLTPIDADAAQILSGPTAVNGDLSAVMGVVNRADRSPPEQGRALFNQARKELDVQSARSAD